MFLQEEMFGLLRNADKWSEWYSSELHAFALHVLYDWLHNKSRSYLLIWVCRALYRWSALAPNDCLQIHVNCRDSRAIASFCNSKAASNLSVHKHMNAPQYMYRALIQMITRIYRFCFAYSRTLWGINGNEVRHFDLTWLIVMQPYLFRLN